LKQVGATREGKLRPKRRVRPRAAFSLIKKRKSDKNGMWRVNFIKKFYVPSRWAGKLLKAVGKF
jgi:hypothetical protein